MKKIIPILLIAFVLTSFMPHKNRREIKCFKQSVPFVVDGKTKDWKTGFLQFDNKTGFAYALSNNDRTLFVQLKMLHAGIQRKALATGFTLWIDPAGKGKHVLGIKYPQGLIHEMQNRRKTGPPSAFRPQHRKRGINGRLTAHQIYFFNKRFQTEPVKLKGFKKAGIKNAFTGKGGIRVLLQLDSLGHAVYEARVPLKMLFLHPVDYLTKDKPFSVIFQTGYLQIDMSRMQAGFGHGGMGGQGMGFRQQPSGQERMAFMQSLADPGTLKIKSVYLFQEK